MTELYWVTILGQLNRTVQILLVISTIIVLASGIGLVTIAADNDDAAKVIIRWFKVSLISTIVLFVLLAFIPSKKDAYIIYGIGGTIDYLKSNDTAKKLPDKCVKALDKVVNTYLEDTIPKIK